MHINSSSDYPSEGQTIFVWALSSEMARLSISVVSVGALSFLACATTFNLTILHTNDFHARFEETDENGGICTDEIRESRKGCFCGVARRATVIDEVRANREHANVLLLDAGDAFQGTDWFYVYRGNATAHFMNLLGYDAMVRLCLRFFLRNLETE